jgi:hypothetical protein
MEIVGRLVLRCLLVPLGGVVAVTVAVLVILAANWRSLLALAHASPDAQESWFLAMFAAWPALATFFGLAASLTLLPALIGVLVAETFAIRSWLFHAGNGGLAAWIGWSLMRDVHDDHHLLIDPTTMVAAGLAAGLAYWLVAGWSAGFWKPVLRPPGST